MPAEADRQIARDHPPRVPPGLADPRLKRRRSTPDPITAAEWSDDHSAAYLRHEAHPGHDFRPVSMPRADPEDTDMDALSMVILAIGSLVCLEVAAANLRGTARRQRTGRAARPRR